MAADVSLSNSVIFLAEYDTWHKQLEHPSKEVFRHLPKNVKGFSPDVKIPEQSPICRGCA